MDFKPVSVDDDFDYFMMLPFYLLIRNIAV